MISEAGVRTDPLRRWLEEPFGSVEIDVGCGDGDLLHRLASRFPTTNFIGIDVSREQCTSASRRIRQSGLTNVSVVNMEAEYFIRHYVPTESVRVLHIYFPTPYPGALGLKHRLLTRAFFVELHRVLRRSGTVRIVTDHQPYFSEICANVPSDIWWPVDWCPLPADQPEGMVTGTACEREYGAAQALQLVK